VSELPVRKETAIEEKKKPTGVDRRQRRRNWLFGLLAMAFIAVLLLFAPGEEPDALRAHLGFWSLLPALVTIVLAFLVRDVIVALFVGIATGGLLIGRFNLLDAFILPSIGDRSYALILVVYLWALGGLLGLWTRTGGAQTFARWAASKIVRGENSARFFAWLLGIMFHQGGTISTLLAGTTARPVTDQHRISHEELTYIVDSTASPAATVIPFNAWPLYVAGLIVGTTALFPTEAVAVSFFFESIRFNFYGIVAVLFTLLFAYGRLPWVGARMKRAIERSRRTGELNAPGSTPLASRELTEIRTAKNYRSGVEDFLVPMGVLLGVAIVPYFVIGQVWIAEAFGLAVLSAFALATAKGMRLRETMDGLIDGCKGVTIGAIILGLAVTLGSVSEALGTADYIVETTTGLVIPALLPAIFMAVCMVVAFSIGSSWGTYAVVFPLAMPLAFAINPDPVYMQICFGAVLGGAVFGDQCSPISDTTILSSLACGADVMDHVTTQIPLAIAAASVAAVASTLMALLLV
jgi:Na+/H+ antiporter NhaC